MASIAHEVYIPSEKNGRLEKIDTVFADYADPEEMRRSLINHDGYSDKIVVKCNGKRAPKED